MYPLTFASAALAATAIAATVSSSAAVAKASKKDLVDTYTKIAYYGYSDSLTAAKTLQSTIKSFLAKPSAAGLEKTKKVWLASRVPYQQTEVYRFGNKVVDDWEGKVNAWPLDEGLIDYVDGGYGKSSDENPLYAANMIANSSMQIAGKKVSLAKITPKLLASLNEAGEVEANVTTGYHAIEFLLWGQDLNGTKAGAGKRKYTDYLKGKGCTNGNCQKRGEYLQAAADLLVSDLKDIVAEWAPNGPATKNLKKNPDQALTAMLTGMGSLSYGELAGERIKLGLILHDPEEEHDCFSDNTHNSHYYDLVGIRNVFFGTLKRLDGSTYKGVGLRDYLVEQKQARVALRLSQALDKSLDAMNVMVSRAKTTERFDQMIGSGNKTGNAVVQEVVDTLVAQTKDIENVAAALKLPKLTIEGSDSLDSPEKVN